MSVINSPLGALGGLMVLLQGLSVGAIAALGGQPGLQRILVATVVVVTALVTVCVIGLVWYVVMILKRFEFLYDPRSFAESVQRGIYLGKPGEPPLVEAPADLMAITPESETAR